MATTLADNIFKYNFVYEIVLTLNMLNCFKDYKRYIHILNLILDLTLPK